jgi:putative ABC transport system permease protein
MNSRGRSRDIVGENLKMALDVIAAHKLRSGLIILGVSIGVASLMGMVSILLGLGEKIRHDMFSSERPVVAVDKFNLFVGGIDESVLRRKDLTDEDARALREGCRFVQHITYHVQPQGRPPYTLYAGNEKSRMISIGGTEPSLFYIWSLDLEEGRMFTDDEVSHRAKVIVLGHSPRRDLFPTTDPIGKKVKIGNDEFRVVGTFNERKTLFGSLGENFAIIPATTYMANLWKRPDMRRIFGMVREGVSVETAKDEMIRVMRVRRKLRANQNNDFDVSSSEAALEFLNRITTPIAAILAAISSIGLLVGGIGVMNMMLVSVTERTTEIGIRKAVGATRRDILWQFLIEAGTLTGIGGIFGIALGLAAAFVVSALTGLPSRLSPLYVVIGVVFSIAIGLFFGIYPANRAARLDPARAMGYAK